MTLQERFATEFGEEQAIAIINAAEEHSSETIAKGQGSDPFKWALVICIDFDCWVKRRFRHYHKIKPSAFRIENWIIHHANLEDYDGDVPPISLVLGKYNKFMPVEEKAS